MHMRTLSACTIAPVQCGLDDNLLGSLESGLARGACYVEPSVSGYAEPWCTTEIPAMTASRYPYGCG